jgi:hypothetical protein
MRNKQKTYWFELKIVAFILAIPVIPILFFVGCAVTKSEPDHYYRIQRLNISGEVQQTYYSKKYPWGMETVSFKEYPSGKDIKFYAPYTAEDIGTNKPN